jgi:hypothetical protein
MPDSIYWIPDACTRILESACQTYFNFATRPQSTRSATPFPLQILNGNARSGREGAGIVCMPLLSDSRCLIEGSCFCCGTGPGLQKDGFRIQIPLFRNWALRGEYSSNERLVQKLCKPSPIGNIPPSASHP